MARHKTHPTRWCCADPDCPQHTWQRVSGYDPEEAQKALERHWREVHQDNDEQEDA